MQPHIQMESLTCLACGTKKKKASWEVNKGPPITRGDKDSNLYYSRSKTVTSIMYIYIKMQTQDGQIWVVGTTLLIPKAWVVRCHSNLI